MKITITGRPISKKNHRRNFGNVSLPSKAFVKFREFALYQVLGVKPVLGHNLRVSYTFSMKGKLDTDCDNMIGGISDILQDAGIIEDDKYITEGEFKKIPGQKDWVTEIEITEI